MKRYTVATYHGEITTIFLLMSNQQVDCPTCKDQSSIREGSQGYFERINGEEYWTWDCPTCVKGKVDNPVCLATFKPSEYGPLAGEIARRTADRLNQMVESG